MIDDAVRQLLSESAQQALETMFFAAPEAISADAGRPRGELIASHLTFLGAPCGSFGAAVSTPLARALAANFFGVDDASELAPGQVMEVVGELTNIICGAVLSELETHSNFDIATPRPVEVAENEPGPDFQGENPISCRLEMPEGAMVLHLAFEEAA
jgi:CheY-specific phosphatase CheX